MTRRIWPARILVDSSDKRHPPSNPILGDNDTPVVEISLTLDHDAHGKMPKASAKRLHLLTYFFAIAMERRNLCPGMSVVDFRRLPH
jgi:hypothetical protein